MLNNIHGLDRDSEDFVQMLTSSGTKNAVTPHGQRFGSRGDKVRFAAVYCNFIAAHDDVYNPTPKHLLVVEQIMA